MSKQIQSKSRLPKSLQYDAWAAFQFGTGNNALFSTNTVFNIPLGLNYKFTHCAYTVLSTYTAAQLNGGLNFVSGYKASAPTAGSSYGWALLAGPYAAGDKVTFTIAGTAFTYKANGRDVASLEVLAAAVVSYLNNLPAFNSTYLANSLGAEIVVQTLTYSTATPTFVVTVTSSAGTVTSNGATMIGGTAGTPPTVPTSDQTSQGIVPSATAVAGNGLFPVDVILPLFTAGHVGQTGTIYAVENYDAIFPSVSTLAAYISNTSATYGCHIIASLYGKPVDNHPMQPEEADAAFTVSQQIL